MLEEINPKVKSISAGRDTNDNGEVKSDSMVGRPQPPSTNTSDETIGACGMRTPKSWIEVASPFLSQFVEVVVFGAAALVALAAINEISARAQFGGLLDKRIADLQSEYVQIGDSPERQAITSGERPDFGKPYPDPNEQKRLIKELIFETRRKADRLHSLEAMGALNYTAVLSVLSGQINRPEVELEPARVLDMRFLSSDYLLAIVIMACALIGSLIGGLRKQVYLTLRTVVLGLGTGFIVYLGIKGGRYLFLIQQGSDVYVHNPFSSGFAGLLAGLFTERAYQFVSSLVEALVSRVEAAVKG